MANFNKKKKKLSPKEKKEMKELFKAALVKDILIMILGGFAIVFGAKYLVEEAVFFANLLNIPETLIGITLIAIGTSLPELTVSITAARKGYGNIAVGNIIGSNIANILLILGVSGLISPLGIIKSTIYAAAPFMILLSILLLVFIKSYWQIRRIEGITFIVSYIIFMALLFLGILA